MAVAVIDTLVWKITAPYKFNTFKLPKPDTPCLDVTNTDYESETSVDIRNSSSSQTSEVIYVLINREKENILLDSKFQDPKLGFNLPFTKQELVEGFKNRKCTATGPDIFTYIFLQHMPESTLDIFLDLFNTIWKQGYVPLQWKTADPCDPNSYRPISLTSNVSKTMEAMVYARLTHFLEFNNLITPFQSGFRKYFSTNDHLVRLQTEINGVFAKGHKVVPVFVDIEKAYDMVW